ncbi:hypothetical protein BDV26DRAFT_302080 [Aspergillus bertholletiae]|uniref:Uncharacterized protein n=1 Tax=Aspergillus bertholletiae TaxID=1226010 RepID=A0A5N7ARD3_9EURO|nr:hypothetical protein BDV26DRAFT_302080 [Aspergillus bertholletiae]
MTDGKNKKKKRWARHEAEPKSIELHSWCRVILDCPDRLSPVLALVDDEERRKDILITCANIRHSAVHRRPQEAHSFLRSLKAAIGLANMHQDTAVVQYIQNLQTNVQAIIDDTLSRKHAIQDKLRIQLEQKAIEDARKETDAYSKMAGAKHTDYINSISHKTASAARVISDSDNFSEPDID